MSTKTYDKKTAAFAGFLIQNIPADLSEEAMDWWMAHPAETKSLLVGLVRVVAKVQSHFNRLNVINVVATAGKPTKDCYTDAIWSFRDSLFDIWLDKYQPNRDEQLITVVKPKKPWSCIEFAQVVLGTTSDDIKKLGNLLVKGGYALTLPQVENLVKRTDAGELTGLKDDGCANFFFVETGSEDMPIAVGIVDRYGARKLHANLTHLGLHQWSSDHCFLLCNADASKL